MSKENLEQFMKQVTYSKELQARIGEEITGDALGAAHGCEFSTEDVQVSAELSDAQMEGVSGGVAIPELKPVHDGSLRINIKYSGKKFSLPIPAVEQMKRS